MTLRALTSADLSGELRAIIYPAEIHRAKLTQRERRRRRRFLDLFSIKSTWRCGRRDSLRGCFFLSRLRLFWNPIIECQRGRVVIIADKMTGVDLLLTNTHTHTHWIPRVIVYRLHRRKTSRSVFTAHSYQTDCLLRSTGSPPDQQD